MSIKFKAVRPVHSPERNGVDAGYDLYVPEFNDKFIQHFVTMNEKYFKCLYDVDFTLEDIIEKVKENYNLLGHITLTPIYERCEDTEDYAFHFNIKVPAGIVYQLPIIEDPDKTLKLEIKNKSGRASKDSYIAGACVCDMAYRDEVVMNMIGFKRFELKPNTKLFQAVVSEVLIKDIMFVPFGDETNIFEDSSNRGGGFGVTGLTQKQ